MKHAGAGRREFKNNKGDSAGKPVVISFSRQRNAITGATLTLRNAFDGNMLQESISKEEF
jgi:hypothetical protein